MAKYMLAYHGGEMPESQEEIDKEMAAWGGWIEKYQSAFVDPGNPVGKSHTISSDGVVDNGGSNPLSGYGIIEAADYDEALAIAKECPHLNSGTIEMAEIVEM